MKFIIFKNSPKLKILIAFFLGFFVLSFNVWEKYKLVQIGYDLQKIAQKIELLNERKNELIIKKTSLEFYKRIDSIAKEKLGMIELDDKKFVILNTKNRAAEN